VFTSNSKQPVVDIIFFPSISNVPFHSGFRVLLATGVRYSSSPALNMQNGSDRPERELGMIREPLTTYCIMMRLMNGTFFRMRKGCETMSKDEDSKVPQRTRNNFLYGIT